MYPTNDLKGIEYQESMTGSNHIVILLLIKPSDKNGEEYLKQYNFFDHLSDKYCSIYPVGFLCDPYNNYRDIIKIKCVNNIDWAYSDTCFIHFCEQLHQRLPKWNYSGGTEVIVIQNNINSKTSSLTFQNHIRIDVEYGIKNNYIDSFQKCMYRLISASKEEVTATDALKKERKMRYSTRSVIEKAIKIMPKLPLSIKNVLKDRNFYKPY